MPIPVIFVISQDASPELPNESTALHTTVSMQDLGVDLTLNLNTPVMVLLVYLKLTRLEPWLVQYPVQLYDTENGVKTLHLNQIHVAAGYGGVGGCVVMFTCRTVQAQS